MSIDVARPMHNETRKDLPQVKIILASLRNEPEGRNDGDSVAVMLGWAEIFGILDQATCHSYLETLSKSSGHERDAVIMTLRTLVTSGLERYVKAQEEVPHLQDEVARAETAVMAVS